MSCRMRLGAAARHVDEQTAVAFGPRRGRQRHLDAGQRRLEVVGGGVGEPLELLVRALELVVAVLELAARVERARPRRRRGPAR